MRLAVTAVLLAFFYVATMAPPPADAGWFRVKPKINSRARIRRPVPKVKSRRRDILRHRAVRQRYQEQRSRQAEPTPEQVGIVQDHLTKEGLKKGLDEAFGLDDDDRR